LSSTAEPAWFTRAIAHTPEHGSTTVDGCDIHYRAWGTVGSPGILLVHGGGANSAWWDHVAPFGAGTHRIVALDMSGHGDSGRRDSYRTQTWAKEAMAAARAGGIEGKPFVVGHSMGGWVTSQIAVDFGDELAGIIIVDSPLNDVPPEVGSMAKRAQSEQKRNGPRKSTLEEIVARFRPQPAQDVVLPYVGRNIAEQSVREVDGTWVWKFDRGIFSPNEHGFKLRDRLPEMKVRTAYVRCEHGLIPDDMAADINELLDHRVPMVELPDSGHHPMLDRPLTLIAAIRATIGAWEVYDRIEATGRAGM
jgi:pimeloyl-ACP methyl ester carboxylesterase